MPVGSNERISVVLLLVVLVSSGTQPLPALDCNGNGTEDATDVDQGTSADCDQNGIPDECDLPPLGLALSSGVFVGAAPQSMVAADFNNDGRADLAAGHRDAVGRGIVSLLLNQGEAPFERTDYRVDGVPSQLAAGDFDGDGHQDVAALDETGLFLLRNDASGALESPSRIMLDPAGSAIVSGDLDGDGSGDLVVSASLLNEILVFWGSPQGLSQTPTTFSVGDAPPCCSLIVEDFNGDGSPDVAVSLKSADGIVLLWNRGDRNFELGSATLEWNQPSLLLASDFNGDSVPDVLAIGVDALGVFANDGKGKFAKSTPFARSETNRSVVSGDFDGDGDLDVALASADTALTIVLNDGEAAFDVTATVELQSKSEALATGDFTGDGALDLAASVGGGVEILNRSTRAPPVSFVNTNFPKTGHWGAFGDINSDLAPDLVVAYHPTRFRYCINEGQGLFAPGKIFQSRWRRNVDFGDAGDFDGDGLLDVVSIDGTRLQEWHNDGVTLRERETSQSASFVTLIDLNGDGADEIVSLDAARRKLATSFFQITPPRVYDVAAGARSVVGGDFDGDGRVDLAVASETASLVTILRNRDKVGRLSEASTYPVEACSFITAGDLDTDGDLDLVTANGATHSISLLFNSGDGTFDLIRTIGVGRPIIAAHLADLSGDRVMDVAAASSLGTVTILLGLGGGAIGSPHHYPAVQGSSGVSWLGVADLDDDVDVDIVALGRDESTLLLNGAAGPDYLENVCTARAFHAISIPARGEGAVTRVAKFMIPARPDDDSLLPPLFQNVGRYELHQDFLEAVFPDRFPALTIDAFDRLVNRRETRDYFVGVLSDLRTTGGGQRYGFTILAGFFDDLDELPTLDETRSVYEGLKGIFPFEPLAYLPPTPEAKESAAGWNDPGFPIDLEDPTDDLAFRAYTRGIGYGRVRILDEATFQKANDSGEFSFQDILVLERAPRDIEGVFGGAITAEAQGALSHLSIRTARRGTPNALVRDAVGAFAQFEGKLVRLEVTEVDYRVEEVNVEEANAWWEQNRVELSVSPTVDEDFGELSGLLEVDLATAELPPESRFGGKATNFARLQQLVLTGDWERYREKGFSIPARYYLEFVRANTMPSAIDPKREVTYEEYVREIAETPEFQTNSRARFDALDELRDHMRDESHVDEELIERLAQRIRDVFGDVESRVRFRSSSNVEDALEFNGAGLYDSTSVCAADFFDPDDVGPSICDPKRENERSLKRGLRRVWRSLWNFRAYEERAFFGIDQTKTAMALLVNRAFVGERANGVAFTGNPSNALDSRYVISVQAGEESVVSPEPGVLPERDILEVVDGEVVLIIRASRSSLAPEGQFVLSNAELEELGALLWHIDQNLPIELGEHQRRQVLLDVEFKIEANGRLAVKQVRPFLLSEAPPAAPPTFTLEIPPQTSVCSAFVPERKAREYYRLNSTIRFLPGRLELPSGRESFEGEMFEEVFVGRGKEPVQPEGPGVFTIRLSRPGVIADYTMKFEQTFVSEAGERLELKFTGQFLSARGDEPLLDPYTLNDTLLSQAVVSSGFGGDFIRYQSCSFAKFPHTEITLSLGDGSELVFAERVAPVNLVTWFAASRLVWADFTLRGVPVQVTDPLNLIFAALRHHRELTYWVVLDPSVRLPDLDRPVHVVEFVDTTRPIQRTAQSRRTVAYLDENLQKLVESAIPRAGVTTGVPFRRGDANADGAINASDAIALLDYVFRDGDRMSCMKSADVNDSGRVSITDAVTLLLYLFADGKSPNRPFDQCGLDPTRDGLRCSAHGSCQGL